MTSVEIKKVGIDGLVSGHTPRIPEEDRVLETHDNKLEAVFDHYKRFLDENVRGYHVAHESVKRWWKPFNIDYNITPRDINTVLQMTSRFEDHHEYADRTAAFITRLISNRHDDGQSIFRKIERFFREQNPQTFLLDTRNVAPLRVLGGYLKGTKGTPVILRIIGNAGNAAFRTVENIKAECDGAGFDFGDGTRMSQFTINGDVGQRCGIGAFRSHYTIHGDAGPDLGAFSKYSTFTIDGDIDTFGGDLERDSGPYTEQLTLKTPNKETLRKIMEQDVFGTRVFFIHSNGKAEMVRSYYECG